MLRQPLILLVLFVSLYGEARAQIPEIYVDSGACPGEGCGYCALYVAQSDVVVYDSPSVDSKRVGVVSTGDTFLAKSGEVHTVPTRFDVHRKNDDIEPGDEVYALTYLGEGYFRIFHNGELTQADLGFSPWGGSSGKTCDNPKYCWGQLARELEYTWWLRIISEESLEGWVIADGSTREIQNKW